MRGYPRNRLTERPAEEVVNTMTTRSRGYTISYDDAGSGPVIVLLPGGTMSAADWRDAGYVDELVGTHRVMSVDPLGLGSSDKPHEIAAYRLPDVADDVIAVMDAAEVDRAVVWGYSYGGDVAAAVAVHHPDRVGGVIFHDGLPAPAEKRGPAPDAEALFRGDFSMVWDNDSFSFSDEDRRYDEACNDPVAIGAMWLAADQSVAPNTLSRIHSPSLVLVSDKGGVDRLRARATALGVDIDVLAGCDHLEAFSRLDLVMPIVRTFLASNGL
jgi:pimeloyl-ACP methyl ester carboxylesterase